jgi:hypothetical protein
VVSSFVEATDLADAADAFLPRLQDIHDAMFRCAGGQKTGWEGFNLESGKAGREGQARPFFLLS